MDKHIEDKCILCDICPCCNEIIPTSVSEHSGCFLKIGEELNRARKKLQDTEDEVKVHMDIVYELKKKLKELNAPKENPKHLNYPKQIKGCFKRNGRAERPVYNSKEKRLKHLASDLLKLGG